MKDNFSFFSKLVSNAYRYDISIGASESFLKSKNSKRRTFDATPGKCEPRLHCVLTTESMDNTETSENSDSFYFPLTINIHRCSSPFDPKKHSKDHCCPNAERCLPTNNGVEKLYFNVKILYYYATVFIKIYLFYLDILVKCAHWPDSW